MLTFKSAKYIKYTKAILALKPRKNMRAMVYLKTTTHVRANQRMKTMDKMRYTGNYY